MTGHGKIKSILLAAAVLCLFSAALRVFVSSGLPDVNQSPQPAGIGFDIDAAEAQSSSGGKNRTAALSCIYFNENEFRNTVATASNSNASASLSRYDFAGGIVPHHLLAGNMIAEFFEALSQSSPKTIVVVGPNHKRIGLNGLHTSTSNWGTAFGILEADGELTSRLIDGLNASKNDQLMENEHSISSLVPYIKYYLPETRIVPLLLHGNYSKEASQKLGGLLAETIKDDLGTIVIASVDFSHYLDSDTAGKKDEATLKAIESRDMEAIARMNNDNLDSPPSILAFLSAMDESGAEGPVITGHSNSFFITGKSADYTTSYYTMLFYRQNSG